jgi:GntR family transcriptional regulator, transcriptional repressor for pyruvate dehydrogenase complex
MRRSPSARGPGSGARDGWRHARRSGTTSAVDWLNQYVPLLSARIHARLRDDILAGRLAPGAPLASERRLSDELGASRHAVREALKRLQQQGLVRISQGGATRVRDWRHEGGLDLLLALAATGEAPPELGLPRAGLELRACVGADAARLCARRAGAAQRAEAVAHAEALAAAGDLDDRNVAYERLWAVVVDGAGNVAYRLALNTLMAGQRVLAMDAALVAAELRDPDAVRALAGAIAAADEARAHAVARDLLDRSVPAEEG